MSIKHPGELEQLKTIGAIVGRSLEKLATYVKPGVRTAELDSLCARMLEDEGAQPSPPRVYNFPGAICISVNDEAIHGIPGDYVIQPGDLVKLDLTAEKNGFVADAAINVNVFPSRPEAVTLAACAENAFRKALAEVRPGCRIYEIGRAVESEVNRQGFSVMRALCGHGVGRAIHEEPQVPNYPDPRTRGTLTEGLVFTIEPIISAGSGEAEFGSDGWTIRTVDRSLTAHYEHTVVVTHNEPILLTAC
ncbi:MAG TPA: type I methionyl aminopeptidase [Terriglobia bacterium]|nr:type I methionyl aminopeptidase [Terriglobia bacterium]